MFFHDRERISGKRESLFGEEEELCVVRYRRVVENIVVVRSRLPSYDLLGCVL